MAVTKLSMAVCLVAIAAAPLAHAAGAAASTASFNDIMTGINALVGSTLDSRASQATTSGLGSMVGKIQSGVNAAPAASASAAAAAGAAPAASTSAASLGFQQLLGTLGSNIPASVATSAGPSAPLTELIKARVHITADVLLGFNVPSVDAGSLSLSLTDIDLSTIYSALHPENFSYCTPPQFVPAELSPAVVLAPATKITIKTGSCAVITSSAGKQLLNCTAPETTYEQTPLTVVQPGYTAATYTDTSCIVAKQLTPSSTEVLYSGGPDITFATVAEWLASFQAPAASTLGLGSTAQFQVLNIPTTGVSVADNPMVPAAEPQTAGASAGATATGKNSTTGAAVSGRR